MKKSLFISLVIILSLGLSGVQANAQSQEAKLIASDGATYDRFGKSVSVSKHTIVVGVAGDDDNGSGSGSAYVFVREKNDWSQEAKLTANDSAAGDCFGQSVSVSKDTIVVGTFSNDKGSLSGSAYVFVREKNGWSQEEKLIASDSAAGDCFGQSVSVSEDTIVVGAPGDDDKGSAYVFVRDKNGWSEEAKLTANDGTAGDCFGQSVSISEDTIVVGLPYDDDKGSAYVFVRDKNGWSHGEKLTTSDGTSYDRFGESVSVSEDTIVVGANGNSGKGSAYVFVRDKNGWSQETKLIASDGAAGDGFGGSVSVSKYTIVVGATGDDDKGSAYVFVRDKNGWSQEIKLTASDGAGSDQFGKSVSISKHTIIIGAPYDHDKGLLDSGSAYVFN